MHNAFESDNRDILPEMFHSEFLGAALRTSLKGDRSLFEDVWERCAPDGWFCPRDAKVETEHGWEGHRRIDILIRDQKTGCVIGIEVKTRDESVEKKQLEAYRRKLCKEFGEEKVAIVFLTPFNAKHAETVSKEAVEMLQAVEAFDDFSQGLKRTRHLSWLDVAEIDWPGGGDLWREHRKHVTKTMASKSKLKKLVSRSRSFADFFGQQAAKEFWSALEDALRTSGSRDVKGGKVIELSEFDGDPHELAKAVRILIERGEGVRHRGREGVFSAKSLMKFVKSDYGWIHMPLFALTEFPYVWLDGNQNYGLRVRHRDHRDGVSLVTSQGTGRLLIGQRR